MAQENCNIESKKSNRKQVCFSDKELEVYGEFLDSKGKFSTYVKKLIEQDFNSKAPIQNDWSEIESKLDELKEYLTEQIKGVKQAPITIQMQAPQGLVQPISQPTLSNEEKASEQAKNEPKKEMDKEAFQLKAAAFNNKFRGQKKEL